MSSSEKIIYYIARQKQLKMHDFGIGVICMHVICDHSTRHYTSRTTDVFSWNTDTHAYTVFTWPIKIQLHELTCNMQHERATHVQSSAILWPFFRHIPVVAKECCAVHQWVWGMATGEALSESVYSVHVNCNFPRYDLVRFLLLDSGELGGRLVNAFTWEH